MPRPSENVGLWVATATHGLKARATGDQRIGRILPTLDKRLHARVVFWAEFPALLSSMNHPGGLGMSEMNETAPPQSSRRQFIQKSGAAVAGAALVNQTLSTAVYAAGKDGLKVGVVVRRGPRGGT